MHDSDVRRAVRAQLAAAHAGDRDTRIVEEMGIWAGSVRIDVAVINGELAGWELKSARDNLSRLPQQAELYSQVFDRMTIVAASNHVRACSDQLPQWWGVTIAHEGVNGVELEPLREPSINPDPKAIQLARLLWRDEAVHILNQHGLANGVRSKPAPIVHERLAGLPLGVLQSEVRAALKQRTGWLGHLTDHHRDVSVGSDRRP
jgi:hypothetical protein